MSHEYIYDGESLIGVRIHGAEADFYPLLRAVDNNPTSQVAIYMKALELGADTPGVWDWKSVGFEDEDFLIFWGDPTSVNIQANSDDIAMEIQSELL